MNRSITNAPEDVMKRLRGGAATARSVRCQGRLTPNLGSGSRYEPRGADAYAVLDAVRRSGPSSIIRATSVQMSAAMIGMAAKLVDVSGSGVGGPPMTARYIAAIDQGTTSSRCMIFDARRPGRGAGGTGASTDLSSAGLGRARRAGDLGQCRGGRGGGDGLAQHRSRRSGGGGHHQPARDDAVVGQGDRRADRQRRGVAGHPHGGSDPRSRLGTAAWTASARSAACRWRPISPGRRSAGCWTIRRARGSGRSAAS